MADSITLPRSGIVLTPNFCGDFEFHTADGAIWIVLYVFRDGCVAKVAATRDPRFKGCRDECIAWLDARVLETRAALLAGDGVREIVARALHDVRLRGDREGSPITAEQYRDADAVLRALGGGK